MIGICGASGYIGWKLFKYLKANGERVMGTYCQREMPGLRQFDLREDNFKIFDKCEYVVLAAAYAKINFCEENKIEAYWLNVYRTMDLLRYLSGKGIPALFISSDAAINYDTTYGIYKRSVEKKIASEGLDVEYIRPGKINDKNINELCKEIYAYAQSGRGKKAAA
jgi:dTDP-4-dehydrorhamnose reductase